MMLDYTLAYVNNGRGTPATVITYHAAGDPLGEDVLSLDSLRLSIMDIDERIDQAKRKRMDKVESECAMTVAEIYYLNFKDDPAHSHEGGMVELEQSTARLIRMACCKLGEDERQRLRVKAARTLKEYQQDYRI